MTARGDGRGVARPAEAGAGTEPAGHPGGGLPGGVAGERLRAIESITDAALRRLDVDDLLGELLERVAVLMGVDTAAVLLLERGSRHLVARAARGVEEEVRQGARVPVGHGFAGRIAATGQPVVLDRVDATTVANPILWEKGIKAMLGVPLLGGDAVIGVLHVGSLVERHFTAGDAELLAHAAVRVAAAVQARELEVERAAGRALQRSLLPSELPACPGIDFATRYVPTELGGVGGDWYDAFLLPDGQLWVMAGDVVGHGLQAAVVMGRLRSTLRSYVLEGGPPEEVLRLADRKLQFFEPGVTATVLCAVASPPFEQFRISLAGHPPPVLAEPGGPAEVVALEPGLPLGVDLAAPGAPRRWPSPGGRSSSPTPTGWSSGGGADRRGARPAVLGRGPRRAGAGLHRGHGPARRGHRTPGRRRPARPAPPLSGLRGDRASLRPWSASRGPRRSAR